MSFLSNDLFLGPFVKASRIVSYFAGSSRAILLMMLVMYQSNLGCGFAVASAVGVIYDWGEQD
jgi:hypothetical protein